MPSISQYLHIHSDDTFEASIPPSPAEVTHRKFASLRIARDMNDPDSWAVMFPVGPEVALCDQLIEELNIIRSWALKRDATAKVEA